MQKFELGNHSESVVLSAYLKEGFIVSVPFGSGASYDLLVDIGLNIYKIQVKTAWISKGVLRYKSLRRQPKTEMRRPYAELKTEYARQELNLRPFGSEPNALSTELRARKKQNYRINEIDSQQI